MLSINVFGQHVLVGHVYEADSRSPVSEASIQLKGYPDVFAVSLEDGSFELDVPASNGQIILRHINFEITAFTFLNTSEHLEVELSRVENEMEEVSVSAQKSNASDNALKKISFRQSEIAQMTSGFGEADVIRTLQQMPGVHKSNEVNAALNVRGTGHGNNSISLDGQRIYNAYHLLGIAPMFNPDILENVSLTKSGFHPGDGAALSSYLDIETKRPDLYESKASLSIGNLTSSAYLEHPIKEGKASVLFAGRYSFFDMIGGIYNYLHADEEDLGSLPSYRLYEYFAKVHLRLRNDWKLDLTTFHSHDWFKYQSRSVFLDIRWDNHLYALDLSRSLSEHSFIKIHSGVSDYHFEGNYNPASVIFRNNDLRSWDNRIDYRLGTEWGLKLELGAFASLSSYYVWSREMLVDYLLREVEDVDRSMLSGVHVNGRYEVFEGLELEGGVRFAHFYNREGFVRVSPRFQVNYDGDKSAINLSYDRTYQYAHLMSPLGFNMPADLWTSAGEGVPIQQCDQLAMHWHQSFGGVKSDFGVFYKELEGVGELATGAELVSFNPADALVFGSGYSYGFETGLHFEPSLFDADVYYTYAHSRRVIDGINGGEPFSPAYDLPHQVDVVFSGAVGANLSWNLSWYLASGQVVTMPTGYVFLLQGEEALPYPIYTSRNNTRMPASHRADVSFQYKKEKVWGELLLSFGIYNLYHQSNPYYLYFEIMEVEEGSFDVVPRRMSIFPMTPFVNVKFRW